MLAVAPGVHRVGTLRCQEDAAAAARAPKQQPRAAAAGDVLMLDWRVPFHIKCCCCNAAEWIPWCPCVQRKDGEAAVGLTQAEMAVLFAKLQREAQERSAGDPEAFPLGYMVWSLDHASAHAAILRQLPEAHKNDVSPHSPDMHKVVEHPINAFNRAWYPEFTADTRCTSCSAAMQLASTILNRTTADSIWKDLQTLPDTLRSVIQRGGDWAEAGLC